MAFCHWATHPGRNHLPYLISSNHDICYVIVIFWTRYFTAEFESLSTMRLGTMRASEDRKAKDSTYIIVLCIHMHTHFTPLLRLTFTALRCRYHTGSSLAMFLLYTHMHARMHTHRQTHSCRNIVPYMYTYCFHTFRSLMQHVREHIHES